MTEEGFDLFSGAMVKVASKKDHEQKSADYRQLAAAARMGDVPVEQLEGLHAYDWLSSFRSFEEKWHWMGFDRAVKRRDWTILWIDEASDIPFWSTPWARLELQKSLLDWPKPFVRMQTAEVKEWIWSQKTKFEFPKRAAKGLVWERDRDWRLK